MVFKVSGSTRFAIKNSSHCPPSVPLPHRLPLWTLLTDSSRMPSYFWIMYLYCYFQFLRFICWFLLEDDHLILSSHPALTTAMNPSYQLIFPIQTCYDFGWSLFCLHYRDWGNYSEMSRGINCYFPFLYSYLFFLELIIDFSFNFLHAYHSLHFRFFSSYNCPFFLVRCSDPAGMLSVVSSREMSARSSTVLQYVCVCVYLLRTVSLYRHLGVSLHLFS